MDESTNPYQSPTIAEPKVPAPANTASRTRIPALAWALTVVPPLTTLASVGLGAFIDSLLLGPIGLLFVIALVGIGALALGVAAAALVAMYLSQGSTVALVVLMFVEIGLVIFVYSQVRPLLGGWS